MVIHGKNHGDDEYDDDDDDDDDGLGEGWFPGVGRPAALH